MWTHLYEQYTVGQTATTYAVGETKETVGTKYYTGQELKGFTGYTFNEQTGMFSAAGEYRKITINTSTGEDCTLYFYFSTSLMGTRAVSMRDYVQFYNVTVTRETKPGVAGPGELVRRFADEAGRWPEDGISDGYWYRCVREFDHPFRLCVQKEGALREARMAYVRVPEGLREVFCGAEARTE